VTGLHRKETEAGSVRCAMLVAMSGDEPQARMLPLQQLTDWLARPIW
jgi:hypothetical protein